MTNDKKEVKLITDSMWIFSGLLMGLKLTGYTTLSYYVCLLPIFLNVLAAAIVAVAYGKNHADGKLSLIPGSIGGNLVVAMMVVLKVTGYYSSNWFMVFWPWWSVAIASIPVSVAFFIAAATRH